MNGKPILSLNSPLTQSVEAVKRLIAYHNHGQEPVVMPPIYRLTAEARIGPGVASPNTLTELSTALDDLGSLAARVSELKREVLAGEAEVLKAIMEKIVPLVPLLSKDYESCYRRELVILTKEERVQLEKTSGFYSEHKLVLYENGLLVRIHRYGEWSEGPRPGWEIIEEGELTPQAAITTFSLSDIADGLIKVLGEASSIVILKDELETRLAALTEVLEAPRCTQ